jgi:hypothetical protein
MLSGFFIVMKLFHPLIYQGAFIQRNESNKHVNRNENRCYFHKLSLINSISLLFIAISNVMTRK